MTTIYMAPIPTTTTNSTPWLSSDLPQEVFDIILDHLHEDRSLLRLRGVTRGIKKRCFAKFKKRFSDRFMCIEGSMTKSGLATLVAIMTDNDCAILVETITIHSSILSAAILDQNDIPQDYKEQLNDMMQAEKMEFEECVRALRTIFRRIRYFPNIKKIKCGAALGIEDFGDFLPQSDMLFLPRHLKPPIRRLRNDLDTGYEDLSTYIDEFTMADFTIAATLKAYAQAKVCRNMIVLVLKDGSIEEIWSPSSNRSMIQPYDRSPESRHDVLCERSLFDDVIESVTVSSTEFLSSVATTSLDMFGDQNHVFRYIRKVELISWNAGVKHIAGYSKLNNHIFDVASSVKKFLLGHDHYSQIPQFPSLTLSQSLSRGLTSIRLVDIRLSAENITTLCQTASNIQRLELGRLRLCAGNWIEVFDAIAATVRLDRFHATKLSKDYELSTTGYSILTPGPLYDQLEYDDEVLAKTSVEVGHLMNFLRVEVPLENGRVHFPFKGQWANLWSKVSY